MAIKLNEFQKEAILSVEGNIAVVASAGSGKSSVLTYRVAHMVKNHNIKPNDILAITFSRQAADNMSKKIKNILKSDNIPTINTFHGVGLGILKENDEFFNNPNTKIATDYWIDGSFVDICTKDLNIYNTSDEVPVGYLKSFINFQKLHLKGYNDELEHVDMFPQGLNNDNLALIYKRYEKNKLENYKIDFSDMIFRAYKLLLNDDKIRKYYQDKWKYVLVDEVQDCNLLQFELIKLINTNNVFAVGDFRQSIYGFLHSSPKFILDFKKHFDNAKYINLPINYRCSKNIVELSNRLISNSEEVSHESYEEAIANNGEHKEPELKFYMNPEHEIKEISKKIINMIKMDNFNYKDIAILMRANAQSSIIQSVFCENNIPYELIGGDDYFERREIRDIINFLKVVNNDDSEAFKKIYNTPSRWLGKVFLEGLEKYSKTIKRTMVGSLGIYSKICKKGYKNGIYNLMNIIDSAKRLKGKSNVGEIIKCIVDKSKYEQFLINEYDDHGRIENLEGFINQASKFDSINDFIDGIQKILEHTEKIKLKKKNGEVDAVKILTAHKSKGLEYPAVFCISLNEGLFPHHKGDLAEERRLCYVAITRAEKELYLSSTRNSNGYSCEPSSFLYEMFDQEYINNKKYNN